MTDKANDEGEKRVDEGWKKRAREEREALEREARSGAGPEEPAREEGEAGEAPGAQEREAAAEIPPPTFTAFVSGLATQAFMTLGLVENPLTGKKEKDLDAAKHLLDTLGMLQEKTQGNLTPREASHLEELLYSLRMAYVKEAG